MVLAVGTAVGRGRMGMGRYEMNNGLLTSFSHASALQRKNTAIATSARAFTRSVATSGDPIKKYNFESNTGDINKLRTYQEEESSLCMQQ